MRTSRGVARKQKSEAIDFQAAQQVVYEELEAWVASVRAGVIVAPEAEGDMMK